MLRLYSHGDIELVLQIYVIGHNIKFVVDGKTLDLPDGNGAVSNLPGQGVMLSPVSPAIQEVDLPYVAGVFQTT